MTATEANLFMTVCYSYQHQFWAHFETDVLRKAAKRYAEETGQTANSKEDLFAYIRQEDIPSTQLSFKKLKEICDYRTGSYKRLAQDIRKTNKKLLSLNAMIERSDERGDIDSIQFPLFNTFETLESTRVLNVAIDRRFARMLFDVNAAYTDNEVREFVQLHSIYSKHIYRQLRRWNTGKWIVSVDEFKRLCCINGTYTYRNIRERIIKPAIEELKKFFPELRYQVLTRCKRGCPAKTLEFTYKPKTEGYRSTGFICPVCGQPLYEKNINGNVQWCHKDGWKEGALCNMIFGSVAEIRGYSETPQRTEEPKDEKAIAVLSEKIENAFGNA